MSISEIMVTPSVVRQKGFNFELENTGQDVSQSIDGFFLMRGWQKEAFEELKTAPLMILNAPMGSGKSWMMCYLSAFKLKEDPKLRCIITVPQTIIASGFLKEKLMMPDGEKIFWHAGHDLCSKKLNEGTIRYVINWLTSDHDLFSDRILVCTHATIGLVYKKLYEENQLELLRNLLLWVDEAHHVTASAQEFQENMIPSLSSNILGKLVSHLFFSRSLNNQIGLATATYFRGDQQNLIPNEMENEFKRYNLPYDKYLETMVHLRSFNLDFIICGKDYMSAVEDLVQDHKKDIIYIPRPNSVHSTGNKHQEVSDIVSKYEEIHGDQNSQTGRIVITLTKNAKKFKILDLVDDLPSRREEKKKYLSSNTIKDHRDDLDVIIALGMFKEGANWIWAERSIIIGSRSSLVDIIQMIGRLFRDADNKKHVEVIQLFPFSLDQRDEMVFRENLNNYLKAIYASLILENIFNPVTIKLPKNNESKSKSKKDLDISESEIKTNWLSKLVPDESQQSLLFEDIIKQWMDVPSGAPKEEFIKHAQPILDKYGITEHKQELLMQMLGQLARRTLYMAGLSVDEIDFDLLKDTHALGFLLRYTSGVSDVNTFQKLREAIHRRRPPLTIELIITWIKQYFDKYQKYPLRSDSLIEFADGNYYGDTWSKIDTALREGLRGLSGDSSLAKLMDTEFGVRNLQDLPGLDIETIKNCMVTHHERTGEWPTAKSGEIVELPNEIWGNIESSLAKECRGLPKSSLAKLREQLGVRNRKNLPLLTEEEIISWIELHYKESKEWPNPQTGDIRGAPNESWDKVDGALKKGLRGLPGSSSLTKLISERFGVRNEKDLKDLDFGFIKDLVAKYIEVHNKVPNKNSGSLPELPGENWATVDSALRRAKRGLPKLSLAKIGGELGLKNHYNLPKISIEEIIAWIQAFHNDTGMWPTNKSGLILYAPYEVTWSAVNIALKDGLRGLPGGSTLPKLLNTVFDVRNPKDTPDLDLEIIKKCIQAFHDRIGGWPNRDSGSVSELPGETWSAVITALTRGSRGLPKGWNIKKLRGLLIEQLIE